MIIKLDLETNSPNKQTKKEFQENNVELTDECYNVSWHTDFRASKLWLSTIISMINKTQMVFLQTQKCNEDLGFVSAIWHEHKCAARVHHGTIDALGLYQPMVLAKIFLQFFPM